MHQLEAAIILRKGTELRAGALATSIVDPLGMEQPQSKPFLSSESRNEVALFWAHASRRNTRRGALRGASHVTLFTRTRARELPRLTTPQLNVDRLTLEPRSDAK